MSKRCGFCGEVLFSTLSIGDQFKCGTIINGSEATQHAYCKRLCGDPENAKTKRPAMVREQGDVPRYDGSRGRWSPVRDAIMLMRPGQTIYFEECDRQAANRAMHLIAYKISHKVLFRHDKGSGRGCHVSMVGSVENMEVGDARLYSDSLKHTFTRLKTLNDDALRGRDGAGVYTFDLIEGVFWIRSVS